MKNRTEFVEISETTALGARDIVLSKINEMTNDKAMQVVELVVEYLELDRICGEFSKEKEEGEIVQ